MFEPFIAIARTPAHNVKSETGLSIGCVYQAHFHADDVIGNRELAKEFAQSEMRLILWPYFRQFAFETSARMSVPPITVPLTTELEKKPGAPGSRRAVRR